MKTRAEFRFRRLALVAAITTVVTSTAVFGLSQNVRAIPAPTNPVDTSDTQIQYGPPSFADLAERVEPAVVSIAVRGKTSVEAAGSRLPTPKFRQRKGLNEFFRHFHERSPGFNEEARRSFQGVGSGFVISADGYVVTNNHVVERADSIKVIMQNGDQYEAVVIGLDPKTDLALLKVTADEALPFVELGDSGSARVGEWVIAVGNPFGLGGSVTVGVVSALGRDINSGPYDDYLQIDAPINRGNSGGPLFNNRGQVIGVNSAIYSPTGGSVGIGFAIPSNMVGDIVAELKVHGKVSRGWLGVRIQPLTDELAQTLELDEPRGALVAGIELDSPAARGGVKPGDVIVGMNGEKLDDYKDLPKRVAEASSGQASILQIVRQGEPLDLTINIGSAPTDTAEVALADDVDKPKLGVYLAELTPESRRRFRINDHTQGVLVTGVEPGSPAAEAGIVAGHVISMLGQETVRSPADVVSGLQQATMENKSSVLLLLEYSDQQRFVAVKIAEA